ncbi:RNP domain-containing protein [Blastomyces dermatitidis ATCC 18188]|uniref:RNP domain-containing protein n=1 Tax=Ajellomyces dermatitidis (strain ATCC 18188 / CBS 674.68) TaxID=653446 RepID=F2TIL5_AJEDA|nr:RNP domain-containing protein [Blastomyces dermatitidis ATCC 18188]
MSLPPPPGLQQQSSQPPSSKPQPYTSLPARPPPSASFQPAGAPGASNTIPPTPSTRPSTGYSSFTAFQPRTVTTSQSASPAGYQHHHQSHAPHYSRPPYGQPNVAYYGQHHQYQQQQHQQTVGAYGQSGAPHIQNPFPYPNQASTNAYGGAGRGYARHTADSGLDPDTEAQIAQWQSAYMGRESIEAAQAVANTGGTKGAFAATGANTGPLGTVQRMHDSAISTPISSGPHTTSSTPIPLGVGAGAGTAAIGAPPAAGTGGTATPDEPAKTVLRSGGGQSWTDSTLLEWDPAHFRLFAGNLAGEVTDDSLLKAFSKYPSVQKARVIRDKRTEKSKGYGFVSFSDGEDYFRAAREMQGKYIGSHPVLLRRAMTEIRPVAASKVAGTGGKGGGKKRGGGGGGGAGKGAGKGAGGAGGGGGGGGSKVIDGGIQKKQGKTKGGLRVLG